MAHLNMEMAPPSPSPGPSTTSVGMEPSGVSLTRENSVACIAHLPPDTQKFLKFAGRFGWCFFLGQNTLTVLGVWMRIVKLNIDCICWKMSEVIVAILGQQLFQPVACNVEYRSFALGVKVCTDRQ